MTPNQQDMLRRRLIAHNAYDPSHEHDACGVGLIVRTDGQKKRSVVEMGVKALKAVWHRGAVDPDGKTGDGAGIRVDIPEDFFRQQIAAWGHQIGDEHICVGQIFLPRRDVSALDAARAIVESEILRFGFHIHGWRQTPVDISVIGSKAESTRPEIEQVLLRDKNGRRNADDLERDLYLCRRRIERRARELGLPDFYICSLSSNGLVYKGLFLAQDIDIFYPDLRNERFVSAVVIYHQRYSTNTFPQWRLAQPFRMLAHNGEINTLRGNENWMKSHEIRMVSDKFGDYGQDVKPVIPPGSSDSAALDAAFELLVRAGRSAPMAKTLLIPEAWSKKQAVMPQSHQALYAYANAVMEPWDGPVALAAFDGRWAIAGVDRNGLRPARYALTSDGILAVGSEAGMCPIEPQSVVRKGQIHPGGLIGVDLETQRFYGHSDLIDELAAQHPYQAWLANIHDLDDTVIPGAEKTVASGDSLMLRQKQAGLTLEDMELVLAPMATEAKEPTGSMGDDSPLAVLSDRYRPLSHYFRQNFSQVTNPPIDSLRESSVMSLRTRFKNLGNILAGHDAVKGVFSLSSPVLTTGMYQRLMRKIRRRTLELSCVFPVTNPDQNALQTALEKLCAEAENSVANKKCEHIVLSDVEVSMDQAAIPMILATGAVHSHLVAKGLRSYCSLIVRAAECIDTHYCAVLIGVGATCVNPWLAQDSILARHHAGLFGDLDRRQVIDNYRTAMDAGLMKILSKMGISVISSYRGGYQFEALGLSRSLVDRYFPGMTSRISGIGLSGLQKRAVEQHARARSHGADILPVGGFYRYRASGEAHMLRAAPVKALQTACDTDSYQAWRDYVDALKTDAPLQIRDLFDMVSDRRPVSVDSVQSVNEIRTRLVTPGMSLGALSPEAHGTLNIAMNRIGAKSVSGEGGEVEERYTPHANGDNENSAVKQVASGRFGVTARYLNECSEIEIKIAQGAKPGEGGQLPGFKVTDFIARNRHSTPGVTLISPPPHHDIYSIEDLSQLIYDLKQINPDARVCVKLVSRSGVGPIASGVAKAAADVILISGHSGGTGASPMTSIKHVGLPFEIGLAEAHQVLTLNGLRDRVTLRTDGGIRTGRDIVIAAMLGAQEYGIGTVSLLSMGCLMVRQCHTNKCPVGVCTQDESLRQRFTGTADKVVRLMTFLAEDVRQILSELGLTGLDEVVGRTDFLRQVARGSPELDDLDLNPLLLRVDEGEPVVYRPGVRTPVPDTLDARILRDARPFFERAEKMLLDYPVANTDRAVGTRSSSEVVRTFGQEALPEGRLTIQLRGSAGQSLGAFAVRGISLHVTGDANDYVGKGLSGASIVLRPPSWSGFESSENSIIGNTCLYGATSGSLFAAGRAAERFAVRNSGAVGVVEGCGTHGCEYMTGGMVVVLGPVGDNFGAGMTGGMAFVYDPDGEFGRHVNPDSLYWCGLGSAHWEERLKSLVTEHSERTCSALGRRILEEWDRARADFWQVVPTEIVDRLEVPLRDAA